MYFLAALLPLLPLVQAAHNPPHLRHRKHSEHRLIRKSAPHAQPAPRTNAGHADAHHAIKRVVNKRGEQCRPRPSSSSSSSVTSVQQTSTFSADSSFTAAPTSSETSSSTSDATATTSINNQGAFAQKSHTASPTVSSSPASSPSTSSSGGSSGGLLNFNDNVCGWCDSSDSAPNGAEDWLNCGINGGGWTPPNVSMDDLVAQDLSASGVFAPCAAYLDKFTTYANQYGVHPIMLASFAMQESTCNQWATGGNGEAGLMQIAPVNCNNPTGDCYDVDYNIGRGAQLFSQMISQNGGNVLAAIGSYNGWSLGMTVGDATAAKSQGDCLAQNNLDYIHQFVNGWMQDQNGYNIGTYFNLKGC